MVHYASALTRPAAVAHSSGYTVERFYLLPAFEDLRKRIKLVKTVGISQFLRYIQYLFQDFGAQPSQRKRVAAFINGTGPYFAMNFAEERYPNEGEPLITQTAEGPTAHQSVEVC